MDLAVLVTTNPKRSVLSLRLLRNEIEHESALKQSNEARRLQEEAHLHSLEAEIFRQQALRVEVKSVLQKNARTLVEEKRHQGQGRATAGTGEEVLGHKRPLHQETNAARNCGAAGARSRSIDGEYEGTIGG